MLIVIGYGTNQDKQLEGLDTRLRCVISEKIIHLNPITMPFKFESARAYNSFISFLIYS